MAKRVNLGIPGVRLNGTGHRVLATIASRARAATGLACEPVQVSMRELSREARVTASTAIRTAHSLEANGLITSEERSREDGGQLANAFALTALGIECLRIADELEKNSDRE